MYDSGGYLLSKQDFFPSHHFLVLGQKQVVGAQCNTKNDGRDAFKTVDPLLSLRALASHVKHPAKGMKQRRYTVCKIRYDLTWHRRGLFDAMHEVLDHSW